MTTDSGVSTDVRTPNDLNQILTQVVTPAGGGSTTYTRTFNGDGTLATKTDGTNHWVYNWSPEGDQRLLSVVYNGTTQASYTYDFLGRMLTRTVSGVTTSFEWSGQTCIRETTSGTQTRYYAPWGQLLTFERSGIVYQVLNDALGSVRVVTDNTGAVVARLDYDAFGNLLATSTDSVPGGMPYRYIGALGCRWDSATGLIYMRQRWYDPAGLQRFISRDKLKSANRYAYCLNAPFDLVDPAGMEEERCDQVITSGDDTVDSDPPYWTLTATVVGDDTVDFSYDNWFTDNWLTASASAWSLNSKPYEGYFSYLGMAPVISLRDLLNALPGQFHPGKIAIAAPVNWGKIAGAGLKSGLALNIEAGTVGTLALTRTEMLASPLLYVGMAMSGIQDYMNQGMGTIFTTFTAGPQHK